ncbi:hypothetical protein ACWDUX_06700 [Streptomyces sp. NPDC003444]|uniref:hypothetical protein n=1 Tax=unclassified Streptomyces TaxID=2593676 RepID=UPI000EF79A16|nr:MULTISPECIES: hypothetical protein [unclassified Streptomyces]MZE55448.1 hypothetical protein [Streptomyces sp. SID5770]
MQPQQPHTVPAPTAPAPSSHRTRTVVLSLIAGLVLGAAGTGVAWALSGDTASAGEGAAGDARAACRALDGFDPAKYTEKGPAGEIALNRYGAADALSASAAAGDARYEPLAQAVRGSRARLSATFEFNAEVKKELDRARALCEDL